MNQKHPAERVDELIDSVLQYARQYGEKAEDAVRQVRPLAERSMKEQPMAMLLEIRGLHRIERALAA